ncbi:protein kinase domain-containing protein [Ktedonobacter robiniae]|uniref:Protein kinase n=1 Tax=Ktedonobacter robiniae TaxID=2778365 RepID=A0ABQ3UMP8_9CHLR|nr:serine/threonine-protein kinase [Ktedonobacter robiniae]GHO54026.1 protein kinase [Ktedonobacter robiniae]
MSNTQANSESYVGRQVGNYLVQAEVQRGSYGSVFQAKHVIFADEPVVALKILHTNLTDPASEQQFFDEARLLRRLKHAHILPVQDAGLDEGVPYFVAAYAVGGSLRDLLLKQQGTPLPIADALRILNQVGDGLNYAHQQSVVHRDLKPENILFGDQGEALLADFGIAVTLTSTRTQLANRSGTPAYMAPEQFEGLSSIKSDQYALGCMAYELLTGRLPFQFTDTSIETIWFQHAKVVPTPPTQINSTIPPYTEQAILRTLAKDREQRFPSVADFLLALNAGYTTQTIYTTPAQPQGLTPTVMVEPANQQQPPLAPTRVVESPTGPAIAPTIMADQPDSSTPAQGYTPTVSANADTESTLHTTQGDAQNQPQAASTSKKTRRLPAALATGSASNSQAQTSTPEIAPAPPPITPVPQQPTLILDPDKARLYGETAHKLNDIERYSEALAYFEQALHFDPANGWLYGGKGFALYHLERYEEALTALNDAIKLGYTNNGWMYAYLGYTLKELHRYQEALQAYDQSLQLDANNAWTLREKGHVLNTLKHYDDALKCIDHSLELDAKSEFAYGRRGFALKNLGRHAEALQAYDQALTLDPHDGWTYREKAHVLNLLKRYPEAVEAANMAIQFDAHDMYAYVQKGFALKNLGHYEEVLQAYNQAQALDPKNAWFYREKAFVLNELKRYEEALHESDQAVKLEPHNAFAHGRRGFALKELKRYEEALQAYDQALQLDANDAWTLREKAHVLNSLKHYDEALSCAEQALRLNPQDELAKEQREAAKRHLRRHKKATEEKEKE